MNILHSPHVVLQSTETLQYPNKICVFFEDLLSP
jgi:hypothetical protein